MVVGTFMQLFKLVAWSVAIPLFAQNPTPSAGCFTSTPLIVASPGGTPGGEAIGHFLAASSALVAAFAASFKRVASSEEQCRPLAHLPLLTSRWQVCVFMWSAKNRMRNFAWTFSSSRCHSLWQSPRHRPCRRGSLRAVFRLARRWVGRVVRLQRGRKRLEERFSP